MIVTLENGTECRFVSNCSGIEKAVRDYHGTGCHVYLVRGVWDRPPVAKFICATAPLSDSEREEVEKKHAEAASGSFCDSIELREKLLGTDGDDYLAHRQGKVSDKQAPPRDICRALDLPRHGRHSWTVVKQRIAKLRQDKLRRVMQSAEGVAVNTG